MSDLLAPVGNASPGQHDPQERANSKRSKKTKAYPLSYAQQRLWFVDQLEPGSSAYIIPRLLRLKGQLNQQALNRSLEEIVRRHEILRTSFVVHEGIPLQRISAEAELRVEEIDLRSIPEAEREIEARRLAQVGTNEPFNLGRGPLLRVKLLQVGAQEYLLLLTMHHIVSDGWSMGIIVREFAALYQAYCAGRPSPLPELKIQYLDYTMWQRGWLQGEVLQEQLAYWRKQLEGVPALDLPADHARLAAGSEAGATLGWTLSQDLSTQLQQLSQREGATLFMTLLAAFQVLLSRYSGQKDIAVGSPIAGRRLTETEDLIGFFVNTLVLRTDLDGNPNFRELLRNVQETTLNAYAHQDVPFEKLVEELRPERDLSRTALFQAMFVLQNAPVAELELPGLKLSEMEIGSTAAKFELELMAMEVRGTITGMLIYRTDLFHESSMQRLLGYWQNLLTEIVSDPQKAVKDLSMLTEAERQQLVEEWNRPQIAQRQKPVHELFAEQAKRTPDAPAVEYGPRRLTYAELDREAWARAQNLLREGATKGDVVVIFTDDRLTLIAAMIGTLKAGCAFVPMSPQLPNQRIAAMMAECAPAWAIVDPGLEERFEELNRDSGQRTQVIARASSQHSAVSTQPECTQAFVGKSQTAENARDQWDLGRSNGDELSYIFFTSGSTGKPKAIAGRLKGIDHFIRWEIETFKVGPGSRISQLTSLMFDPILRDIFVPLCSGGTLCIPAEPEIVMNANGLAQWLELERITLTHIVPSIFRLMVNHCASSTRFADLRHVLLAGEPMLPSDIKKWHDLVGSDGARLVNVYGPSETTMAKFLYPVDEADQWRRTIPIGKPMSGAAAVIVDEGGRACPPGIAGEIYIRTPYRSLGYYRQPELTAQVFVPNPFSNDPEDIVYKTGDLGRVLENGSFDLLGRRDHQVKIRGVRIELAEVEAALSTCEGVGQAVAVARDDQAGGKRLIAYVVASNGVPLKSRDLQSSLRKRLPEYMVPSALVVIDALPLSPNGKVDRSRLPEPASRAIESEYVGPRTAEEEILCGIWQEVLKQERVGIEESFFELGGHSLMATQLMARVRSALNVELPLRALFEAPTVAALAERIKQQRRKGERSESPPLRRVEREGPSPLSYAQQRLWLLDQLQPLSAAYNMSTALRLQGEIQPEILQQALSELVSRHEVLRTRFAVVEGEARQLISATDSVQVALVDLSLLGTEERETEARRRAREEAEAPFDLSRWPLLRVKLLRLAEQEHVLLVTMHHIVSDAWSLGIIVREFAALYQAYAAGLASPLSELTIQYADYAVWQREWLQRDVLEQQVEYWKRQLADVPVLDMPTDRPRPALMTQRGATLSFGLPAELTGKLQALSLHENATLFMTLLSGFQLLLSRYSGQQDIAIGSPIAGRTRAETEDLIGFFVNTLVLRTRWSGEPSFRTFLCEVRTRTLEAYGYQDVPFEKLVEELKPERDLSRSPLFQVAFAGQNMDMGDLQLPGIKLSRFDHGDARATKFDLLLAVMERDGGIRGSLEYNIDLFDAETMVTLGRHFQLLLEQVVQDPGQRIARISLLSEAERQVLVQGWRGPAVEGRRNQNVPALVAEQAERRTQALAMVADGKEMTYGELNRQANQLAQYLGKQGVRLETRVGVCLDGAADVVVAALAVLKCGGVLVGLDADEPPVRNKWMLQAAGTALVITEDGLAERFPQGMVRLLYVDEYRRELTQQTQTETGKLPAELDGNNLACVVVRSGGVGGPVGVVVSHGLLCDPTFVAELSIKESDRVALALSCSQELAWLELFRVLACGACVVNVPSRPALAPRQFANLLREQKVTVLWAAGPLLERVGREFASALKGVRQIICDERIGAVNRLRETFKGQVQERVYGLYGSSDAGGRTVMYPLAAVSAQQPEVVEVNHLAAGAKLYVLDDHLEPVPEGLVGEIYVGGESLAVGYDHEPAPTARAFVPDPFSEVGGARLYRTGDRARRRRDGRIEYRERQDGCVVLRGVRVAGEEIEAVLNEHPEIREAAVVAREVSGERETSLAAAVVTSGGQSVVSEDLKSFVRERLPEAMVPQTFTVVEAIARTGNGEVDRRAVVRMLEMKEISAAAPAYVAPRNQIEEQVAGIWAQTFGVEQVGIHDNFFRLGGHSLLAMQVAARISDVLHVELPLRRLFEAPTIAALADWIKEANQTSPQTAPPLVAIEAEGAVPLSYAQERLWFIDQMEPASSAYNIAFGMRFTGRLNKEAMNRSLNEIVRRHEVLRTTFPAEDGKAVQAIADELKLALEEVDLSQLNQEAREQAAREQARIEAEAPFDLARGPLLRVKLLRMGEEDHVALATMHHMVSDGWSIGIMVREFSRLYEAYVQGEGSPLEELKIQYSDFAVWQRAWLQGEVLEEQLGYWKDQLAGIEVLNLPTDHARKPLTSDRSGGNVNIEIGHEMTSKLREIAHQQEVTLFMLLVAALDVVLWRYSEQSDIAVGTGIANRNRVEIEGLIGFFVNNLVLRTQVEGQISAQELLERVRQTTLEAYRHPDVSFERLVAELQPERDLTRTPLFQVALVLQNFTQEAFSLPNVTVRGFQAGQSAAKLDLTLMVIEDQEKVRVTINYATELYEQATVERLGSHWTQLLAEFVGDLSRPVRQLSLMTGRERWQVVEQWSGPQANDENDVWKGGIGKLFAQQAARTPTAVAVIWEGGQISYQELGKRVWQMARYLRELGVAPEERVSVCLEPGAELIVAILGAVVAGAAYVPLDPDYPAERLTHIVADTQPVVLVTEEKWQDKLPQSRGTVVCVERESKHIAQRSTEVLDVEVKPDHLLYVIYTSGSTGRPKGVAISQGALLSRIAFVSSWYQASTQDRHVQMLSPSFDAFNGGMFTALLSGGALVFAPAEKLLDPEELLSTVRQKEITLLRLPVGYLREILSYLLRNEITVPGSVRLLVTGGETISRPEMKEWLRRAAPLARFIHEYGPTETAVTAALREDDSGLETIPYLHRAVIGKPNADTKLYVLEDHMTPLAVGVPGELYIGGAGVGRGYVETPELTAEKFVPDLFSRARGKRLYRTGDWVRWLEDGSLEFLGRRDEQVKVNGYRIELGEIEAALRQHPGLREAVVVVREDEPGSKRLAGYIVAAIPEGPAPTTSEVRKFLLEKLPEYMVPGIFVELADLPLMPGGKLDRKRLPKPALEILESEVILPRTPVEQILCSLWSDVLKREQVGVDENFFELGGHSLLATQVIARIRNVFNIELPLRALFEAPTVAGLAERIEQLKREESAVAAPPMTRVDRNLPLPLSFAQQRLWFIDQLEPNTLGYNTGSALLLKGELNTQVLEQAFQGLVRRHEVLRTRFEVVDGEASQVIAPEAVVSIPVTDLSVLPPEEREAEARRRVREEAEKPFHLDRGPLLRVNLLRLAEQEHVVIVVIHHIVCDGWSVGIIVRELTAHYEAYIKGEKPPLEDLKIQYADFAVWQRNWLQGQVLDDQLRYWRKQLADVPPLELPSDYPRSALGSDAGAKLKWDPSDDLSRKLKELSRREGVTFFMTLLAGLQLLLSRYSGQKDVTVGTPIAGRRWTEIESLIGFLANTLVLRADLSGKPSFKELLGQVREATLEAYRHQDVPFEKLVEELRPERDLSRTPLFQVMLVLQNVPYTEAELPGLTLSGMDMGSDAARFDLELTVVDTGGKVGGVLAYRTNLFAESSVRRLLGNFENLLCEIVKDQHRPVNELPILSLAERQQILVEWNRTETRYSKTTCVLELFEEQVARTPTAVAVEFGEEQLTYAELNGRANQLGRYLRKLGIRTDQTVGISAERDLQLMTGILSILKTGAAYVPLDPRYPPSRLSYMLEDSNMELLLTQEQFLETYSSFKKPIICLDTLWHEIAQQSEENLNIAVDGANLAFLVYTSGSTGKPKGVAMVQGALTNLVNWQRLNSAGGQPLRTIQFASVSFDVSFQEIFSTWCAGGSLILLGDDTRRDPLQLWQVIRNKKVERIFLPFVALQQLAEVADIATGGPAPLREVITAGEQLKTTPVLQRFFEQLPSVPLENHYGPSETHVITVHRLAQFPGEWPPLPPIGKAIANAQVYVLDEACEPVPVGVVGEVYLGGVCLSRGYMNRPDWTAERFVPNHLGMEPGTRLYRTGDIARYLPNGELDFMGRKDHQVKLRGFRIELGEIEAVLQEHPQVEHAAVAVREDQPGEKRLVGYLVSREKSLPPMDELRKFLREKLPDYMVPALFVELQEVPLTPTGKLDRKRLPKPEGGGTSLLYVAPKTAIEEIMCSIWAEVLRREQVGTQDNFFDIGGHSLLATQVMARIGDALHIELPVRRLFEAPTVAGLALVIDQMKAAGGAEEVPPIVRVPRDQAFPLSFAQQRLWFLDQLQPGSAAYNIPVALRLHGALQINVIERALSELVRRHEALRTTFETVDGDARQVIATPSDFTLVLTDLTSMPAPSRETEVLRLAQLEVQHPFDLSRGPLLRVKVVRIEHLHHVLLLTMHHIVTDGWSMGIIVREIARLYEAYLKNEDPGLLELKVQYADYAVWQRAWLQGEVLERQIAYWRKQLAGVPILDVPTDHARGPVESPAGASIDWELPEEVACKLKELSRREGVTLFMALLAGFQLLLSRYSGQQDIAVGSPIAGRTRTDTNDLIGFFVNTLVLRTHLSGGLSFRGLLAQVREKTLEAYEHQDVPFEKLVEELHPERDLSRPPLFQVMFSLLNIPIGELELPGLKLSGVNVPLAIEKFEMSLFAGERQGRIQGLLSYRIELFAESSMKRLVDHFKNLLTEVVGAPQRPVGELTMLSAAERQLLLEWNPALTTYPQTCIHELFEAQVQRTPNAVAVIHEERQLSYVELDRKANQLAQALRRWELGPEALVAICVERGLEMIIGLLGILKAGAAYVPLDPAYPKERMAYMLEDTQAPVLLTQRRLRDQLPPYAGRVVELDGAWADPGEQDGEKPASKTKPENLAYVIYTSGSTGKPKGTGIEHRNAATLLHWAREIFAAEDLAGVLASTSICFDLSIFEIFVPLSWGGTVIVAETALQLPQLRWAEKVTLVNTVPSAITELIRMEGVPAGVRTVNLAGEALMRPLVEKIYQKTAVRQVFNLYGPTEDTTYSTYALLAPGDRRVVEIGRPIANTRGYVLHEAMELTPVGLPGTLYLAGEGLARGYLGRGDLTAERFVPNPFSETGGERLYRTGDLVRYREDGSLEFLGRVDHQVKIRGYRIELGEIEAALQEHPGVEQTVVVAREDSRGEKRLIGYVAGKDKGAELTLSELRSHLKERLPEYMMPSVFVQLERLPLTPNGKVDRKNLPLPTDAVMGSEKPFVAPRDFLEKELAVIWEDLLGKRPIGVTENFFEIGGHSILAVRLIARIESHLSKRLAVAVLFQGATIESLAQALRSETKSQPWSPLVPIQPDGSNPPLFFVHAVGGQVLSYLDLGRHLGQAQPLYGLQSRQGNKESTQHARLEEMASEYVEAIRAFQTVGPYRLGGWSMGGVIAFEMARQMHDQGQEVALLALVDSYAPSIIPAGPRSADETYANDLANFALHLGFTQDRITVAGSTLLTLPPAEQLAYLLSEAKASGLVGIDMTLHELSAMWEAFQANFKIMTSYRGGSYQGKVTLFCAESQLGAGISKNGSLLEDREKGWGNWAQGVEVIPLPGNHFTIIREPQVKVLAEQLLARLETAAQGQAAG
jgi:amino acid adenylation domain-containing protein